MPGRRLVTVCLALAACRGERAAPPAAEFLLVAGDSTFWVTSGPRKIRLRGSPIHLARLDGRFYELYITDDDRSHYGAVLVGQRIYRRDLVRGDSLLVFEDTSIAGVERWYQRRRPDDRPLADDEDASDDPEVIASGEVELLALHPPFLSYEYRTDVAISGGSEWHLARRGVVDLRTGKRALLADILGDTAAARIIGAGRQRFSQALDSVLASRDARASEAARAIADFEFDSSSFAIVQDGEAPAVEFAAPGQGAQAGGKLMSLLPIPASRSAPWWATLRRELPRAAADSSADRWTRGRVSVVAHYDPDGERASLMLIDSTGRRWAAGRLPVPALRLLWLDQPPLDAATREALARAFNEAALYSEDARTAFLAPRAPVFVTAGNEAPPR